MKLYAFALIVGLAGPNLAQAETNANPLTWEQVNTMSRAEARATKKRLVAELEATGFSGRVKDDFKEHLDAANALIAYRCERKDQQGGTKDVALFVVSADQRKLTYRENAASATYTVNATRKDDGLFAKFKMDLDCDYAPAGNQNLKVVCQRAHEKIMFSPQTLSAQVTASYGDLLDRLIYSPYQYQLGCQAVAVTELEKSLEISQILRHQIDMIQARLDRSLYN